MSNKVLATRYAVDLKPPEGVTRMYNYITEKYYTWNGTEWEGEVTGELLLSRNVLYTYYKSCGGWYPCYLGGWVRLCGATRVFEEVGDAKTACPEDCKVVAVFMTFRKSGDTPH